MKARFDALQRALLIVAAVAVGGLPLCGAEGEVTCATCHRKQAAEQPRTAMANAMQTVAASPILKGHQKLTFRQGPYSYEIERKGDQSWYRVTDGKQQIEAPIGWSMGQGFAGQTYLLERNGVWHESRVSYYKRLDGLDLTTGARPEVPANIDDAFGRRLSDRGALECFNCHSTHAVNGGVLRTDQLTTGVQCARCHEKTTEHVASLQNSEAKTIPPKLGTLSSEETSDFCGQCHRTWAQIATTGPHNINNVRFQPYRLTNSRCYDATDDRMRCTSCHDPHQELVREPAFYDKRCLSCHATATQAAKKEGAKACKAGKTENCAGCHMPRVEIPQTHHAFTDHWIRLAKKGDPYPN